MCQVVTLAAVDLYAQIDICFAALQFGVLVCLVAHGLNGWAQNLLQLESSTGYGRAESVLRNTYLDLAGGPCA